MPMTDKELAALYERYANIVLRRCRAILGNEEDARDALHETFARVIRHQDEFRREASPLTWMYRISTNLCLNEIRNRTGRRAKLEHRGDEVTPEPLSIAGLGLDDARIRDLLGEVDDETRACVVHTWFDECTRQEVADLVGLSVPTVRKRLETFLALARQRLQIPSTSPALLLAPLLGVALDHLPWSL